MVRNLSSSSLYDGEWSSRETSPGVVEETVGVVVVDMLSDEEDNNTDDGRVKATVVDWSSDANLSTVLMSLCST
jgi:hypothetical protein